ncbi:GCG_CRPN prefix-to-repeats domain-containing protein [Methylobacterium aerolatum]|uniref:Sulfur globule protein n=1 Tax=Methylobacterium aerolatum TaxID=418708 RepID=A0ABU0HXQ4_9HYPH|nr:hypothetical protein [Methylobacterium aerolatum]MDQ0447096.1 hypothetical protein [Methylobacterium aerolatum]GJD37256.1 hypothetical protein FMGBMHLM_4183 [Methylobacterium aerolatum]
MRMKLIGATMLAVGAFAGSVGGAQAQGGCGFGFHRTYYGFCRPNVVYRPYAVRPIYYGYGYRRWGWHRPWGWHRHWG